MNKAPRDWVFPWRRSFAWRSSPCSVPPKHHNRPYVLSLYFYSFYFVQISFIWLSFCLVREPPPNGLMPGCRVWVEQLFYSEILFLKHDQAISPFERQAFFSNINRSSIILIFCTKFTFLVWKLLSLWLMNSHFNFMFFFFVIL